MVADLLANDDARLEALNRYDLELDRDDPEFNTLVELAGSFCRTSMAFISFVVSDRVLIKSAFGLALRQWPRRNSFAAYVVCHPNELLVVPDARDDLRFVGHPMVAHEPHMRFFAATALVAPSGHAIGLMAVADGVKRGLSDSEGHALHVLAAQVMRLLELRQTVHRLSSEISERSRFEQELFSANAELSAAAMQDVLTHIANRRAFEQRLMSEIQRADRLVYPLSLLTVDLDQFKRINDDWGHTVGDQALREVAKALVGAARKTDFVARVGGDEFALILPGSDIEGAAVIGERCRRAVEGLRNLRLALSISVGVAEHQLNVRDELELIAKSDLSLLSAKRLGRNRVVSTGATLARPSNTIALTH